MKIDMTIGQKVDLHGNQVTDKKEKIKKIKIIGR